jgi:DNA-binding GntR family transcriptional regulator
LFFDDNRDTEARLNYLPMVARGRATLELRALMEVSSVDQFQLDRGRRAAPQVYEWLREQILTLHQAPGTTISRSQLVKRFGLSQTPIRDALLRLSGDGLVDIFPQSTTRVSPIDLQQATQIHFLRRGLELEIVRTLALAADKPFVPRLQAIIAGQTSCLESGDIDGFEIGDQAFHRQMYESANVPDLWRLIRERSGHIDRLRRLDLPTPGKIEEILVSHTAILRSIAASKGAEAQRHLREHLSGTLSRVNTVRKVHPSYVKG